MDNASVALWTFVAACVTALATVFAAAITAWFNLKAVRLTAQIDHVREERSHLLREVEALLHQVSAFHACEDAMTHRLIEVDGGDLRTVKGRYRRAIPEHVAAMHGRPSMTRTDCERRLAQIVRGHVIATSPEPNGNDSV